MESRQSCAAVDLLNGGAAQQGVGTDRARRCARFAGSRWKRALQFNPVLGRRGVIVRVRLVSVVLLALFAGMAHASSIKPVNLSDLFQEADVVALIEIDGGDTRAFKQAIYRAVVHEGFKGTSTGQEIYLGPYSSYRVGGEYVVFLKAAPEKVGEALQAGPGPWPDAASRPLLRVMYAGYSTLPVEFSCALPQCAYAVSVPSTQVVLPSGVARVAEKRVSTRYDSWVERETFLKLLRGYARGVK